MSAEGLTGRDITDTNDDRKQTINPNPDKT